MHRMRNIIVLVCCLLREVWSVEPTAILKIQGEEVRASDASFGASLPLKSKKLDLILHHAGSGQGENRDGCTLDKSWWQEWWQENSLDKDGFAILAARSPNCSFGDRMLAVGGVGGKALIVYDTIEGIYRNRSTAQAGTDYECSRGQSWVSKQNDFNSIAAYKSARLDGFKDSGCAQQCESKRCLLTGATNDQGQEQICCAWDTYLRMAASESNNNVAAVYVRMIDYDIISKYLTNSITDSIHCYLYDTYNARTVWFNALLSSFFIWILGIATCSFAAMRAADDIEAIGKHSWSLADRHSLVQRIISDSNQDGPNSLELTLSHAVGFIIVASIVLIFLFYLDATKLVVFIFTMSASIASFITATRPLCAHFLKRHADRPLHFLRLPGVSSTPTLVDLIASILSFSLAIWWLSQHSNPKAGPIGSWILQDFFGICLCVLFLQLVQLNSLKVATMLLGLALCYDVFFVFLTPYLFHGQSIMVTVAAGRGPSRDADYCDKYPDDADCASTQLPMLLMLPEGLNSDDGYSMLGLGDIVLPGLLLALAARYDAANRILRNKFVTATQQNRLFVPIRKRSYFPLLIIGYAAGLACANLAVAFFDFGQPALLYLVPSTLGLFCLIANSDGTLSELWRGPPELSPSWLHDELIKRASSSSANGAADDLTRNNISSSHQSSLYQAVDDATATIPTEHHALLKMSV
mmetsp:Transcript_18345/g.27654  ORF Transcript_18345/g.27654 Transcript_18345/m.27654 type:complete len:696 (+) Transcript_18345:10-2097(+)